MGMAPRLELRLGYGGTSWNSSDSDVGFESRREPGDVLFGMKTQLDAGSSRRPVTSLLLGVALPLGHSGPPADPEPEVLLAFSNPLGERFGLGYNVGFAWHPGAVGGEGWQTSMIYSSSLGIGIDSRTALFAEVFGETAGNSGGIENSVDSGVTFKLANNLQVDAAAGFGLNEAADDWFVGFGLAVRLPD